LKRQKAEATSYFAITAPGLESLCAAELRELGAADATAEAGGVSFSGDARTLYRVNLGSRLASRVIARVAHFEARAFHELERLARQVPWDRYVAKGGAVKLRVTCRKSRLYHSDAVAQRIAEAISRKTGATVGSAGGEEAAMSSTAAARIPPDADASANADEDTDTGPGQLFVIRFLRDQCTISVDSSGELLHRRGYRQAIAKAPLRETLAAGMLRAIGWRGDTPLIDPMCGSGTIPIEGALMARRVAPGLTAKGQLVRDYAFTRWPGHDESLWTGVVEDARSLINAGAIPHISGSDRDEGAITASVANAERAGVEGDIEFTRRPVSALEVPAGLPGSIVTNPPYGERVGAPAPLRDLYAALGHAARANAAGWTLAILAADPALAAEIRLRLREVLATNNGGIPVKVLVGKVEPGR
jgi:putative N6-adenine-specific DNA methylase